MRFSASIPMPRKIRVLVVDDSAVMRRLLSEAIQSEPGLELAGTASHGALALSLLPRCAPDVVTLDLEMPYMNGLETLKAIRAQHPDLPVVMFSSLTVKGAAATIECLSFGASDYVTKPQRASNFDAAIAELKGTLIPKLIALCSKPTGDFPLSVRTPAERPLPAAWPGKHPLDIVAIGCSTGGPKALSEVLPSLPAEFPVPIVVVQHMPPVFTRALAERLDQTCHLPVQEARHGAAVLPGHVWIAQGDYHMELVRVDGKLYLSNSQAAPENFCRPSVDVLFHSLAQACASRVLAVMLTGMGQDGLRGCTQLNQIGAQVIVQDEESSIVWGMPGLVAKAGLAQAILPLSEIGPEIVRRVQASRFAAA